MDYCVNRKRPIPLKEVDQNENKKLTEKDTMVAVEITIVSIGAIATIRIMTTSIEMTETRILSIIGIRYSIT